MDTIYDDLAKHSGKLYEEKKFKEVEQMFSTFLQELEADAQLSAEQFTRLRARALNQRGHAKYQQVDFPGAIADYSLALTADPDLAQAHFNRATVHYRMMRYDEASVDFRRAVELDPDNAECQALWRECQAAMEAKAAS